MIYPSLTEYTPGRAGHLYATIYDPATGLVVDGRSTAGIAELPPASGSYLVVGGLDLNAGWIFWDDDGAPIGATIEQAPVASATLSAPLPVVNGTTGIRVPFVIKRGDSAPSIQMQAFRASVAGGAPAAVNISGAAILFTMRVRNLDGTSGGLIFSRAGRVIDGPNGVMQYDWQHSGADTHTAGEYNAEFQVTFPDGSIETFPTTDPDSDAADEYVVVKIPLDLDLAP